jgi:hypothetical protein
MQASWLWLQPEARRITWLTRQVIDWLTAPSAEHHAPILQQWDVGTWQTVQRIVFVQGLAAYLHWMLPVTSLYAELPEPFRQWLAEQYELNGQRVALLHGELQAILQAAHSSGIRLIPLKGSLLSTLYYPEPMLRPMGDLDFLVRPQELPALSQLMIGLGYNAPSQFPDDPCAYRSHYKFSNRRTPQIVSYVCEHPANPRPVEIHTALRRGIWGDFAAHDLTDLMWSQSKEGCLLGSTVLTPPADLLFSHQAIHALRHLLMDEGRAIQWVDLVILAPYVQQIELDYANWLYPILRLTSRALPNQLVERWITTLAPHTDARLREWADTIPLDTTCGLAMRYADHEKFQQAWWGRIYRHLQVWRPNQLRFALFPEEASWWAKYRQYLRGYRVYLTRRLGARWRNWWQKYGASLREG